MFKKKILDFMLMAYFCMALAGGEEFAVRAGLEEVPAEGFCSNCNGLHSITGDFLSKPLPDLRLFPEGLFEKENEGFETRKSTRIKKPIDRLVFRHSPPRKKNPSSNRGVSRISTRIFKKLGRPKGSRNVSTSIKKTIQKALKQNPSLCNSDIAKLCSEKIGTYIKKALVFRVRRALELSGGVVLETPQNPPSDERGASEKWNFSQVLQGVQDAVPNSEGRIHGRNFFSIVKVCWWLLNEPIA